MKDFKISPKDIVRKEVDGTHYYYINNEWFPSVTAIIDAAGPKEYGLLNFFKNNSPEEIDRIKTDTANFGTQMHQAFEKLLYGYEIETKDYVDRGKKILCQFSDWFKKVSPTQYLPEHTVAIKFGDDLKYAGTLDLLATVPVQRLVEAQMISIKEAQGFGKENITVIVDFKTTSGIYYSHKIQVKAYQKAVESMYNKKVDACFIARFGTKHKCGFEMKLIDDVSFEDFMSVLTVYKSLNGGKLPDPPLITVYPETIKIIEGKIGEPNE